MDDMREAIERQVAIWSSENAERAWEDEVVHDGTFINRVVLLADRSAGNVTILRAWTSADHSGEAAISVDLDIPYSDFSAPDISDHTFPHMPTGRASEAEIAFRAELVGEAAEIVYAHEDAGQAFFIARSAKVGRDEQVVAAKVTCLAGEKPAVSIGYRAAMADFAPVRTAGLSR